MVRWLRSKGYNRVGLIRDAGVVGDQYHTAFHAAAGPAGVWTVVDATTDADRETLRARLIEMRENGAQALIWLEGLSFRPASYEVAGLLRELGW